MMDKRFAKVALMLMVAGMALMLVSPAFAQPAHTEGETAVAADSGSFFPGKTVHAAFSGTQLTTGESPQELLRPARKQRLENGKSSTGRR